VDWKASGASRWCKLRWCFPGSGRKEWGHEEGSDVIWVALIKRRIGPTGVPSTPAAHGRRCARIIQLVSANWETDIVSDWRDQELGFGEVHRKCNSIHLAGTDVSAVVKQCSRLETIAQGKAIGSGKRNSYLKTSIWPVPPTGKARWGNRADQPGSEQNPRNESAPPAKSLSVVDKPWQRAPEGRGAEM